MNHKRGRSKNQRAGCLLCKPHKANGAKKTKHNHKRMAARETACAPTAWTVSVE